MNKIKPVHILKIGLGIDMLMHGLIRLPNLAGFVHKSAAGFTDTFLPEALTTAFLYALPFIEAIIGVLILIGGKLGRVGLVGGGLFIAVLLFGTTVKQSWPVAAEQVTYLIAFALALHFHDRHTSDLTS
jgi:thiosulfate dehydrogenase [quinone] large subunit